jgi:hypothetical protein
MFEPATGGEGMTIEQLEAAALQLPRALRARLAAALVTSLEDESELERDDDGDRRGPLSLTGEADVIPLHAAPAGTSRSDPPSVGGTRPATRIRIDAGDLLFAMDSHDAEVENYLDLETGEIIPAPWGALTDDEPLYAELDAIRDDATRYRLIDPVPSRRGWGWMSDYAETVANPRARERLLDAIEGSGAFGRFKRVLSSYEDLRQGWFRFQEERLLEYAREWLEDEDIDAELTHLPGRPSGPRLME